MSFLHDSIKNLSFGKIVILCLAIGLVAKLFSSGASAAMFNREDMGVSENLYDEVQNIAPDFLESNTNFKIKKTLEESAQTGEANLDTWMVGTTRTDPNGWTGSMDAMLYWITESLGGPNLYKASVASTDGSYHAALPGGALGDTANIVSLVFANQPVSSIDYIAYLGQNMGFSKSVYAQGEGIGFSGLSPILPLWRAFRDIAYLFFALVFVVIGLTIMFRVKINPQTVVSVQNAIPQIIIALLLVTFSYAIAGFMIDLAYVVMFLILEVFKGAAPLLTDFQEVVGSIDGIDDKTQYSMTLFAQIFPLVVGYLASLAAVMTVPILNVIVLIMLVYTMIRIIILLITTHVKIIFAVIFGPIQLALGAIPGQGNFGKWFRNLLSNIAVLPTVFTMFLLAGFFITYPFTQGSSQSLGFFAGVVEEFKKYTDWFGLGAAGVPAAAITFVPAQILAKGYALITGVTQISTEEIFRGAFASGWGILSFGLTPLLGLGTFFLIPKAGEMVRDALQVTPWKYGTGFGEAIKPLSKPAGYVGGIGLKAGVTGGAAGVQQKAAAMFGAKTSETEPDAKKSKEVIPRDWQ